MATEDVIRYARSGDTAIAYCLTGEGPRHLVFALRLADDRDNPPTLAGRA